MPEPSKGPSQLAERIALAAGVLATLLAIASQRR
jgi:hypothetical protein